MVLIAFASVFFLELLRYNAMNQLLRKVMTFFASSIDFCSFDLIFSLDFLFLIFQIYIWRTAQLFDRKSIDRMKNYWFRLVANEIQLAKLLHSDFISSERRIWNDLPLNGDIWSIVCYFSKRRPNETNINIVLKL